MREISNTVRYLYSLVLRQYLKKKKKKKIFSKNTCKRVTIKTSSLYKCVTFSTLEAYIICISQKEKKTSKPQTHMHTLGKLDCFSQLNE